MSVIIYFGHVTCHYHLTFAAGTARAAGPMRDQFLDELGGVHVLPESSKGAGRMEVTIDERVVGRPLDEHGDRAVEDRLGSHMNDIGNWADAEGSRRPAAGRFTAWAWVAGTVVTALPARPSVACSLRE